MELQLKIIGALLIPLSLIHLGFPRYFEWKKEFSSVSLMNRQMMYIHTLFIGLVILMIGVLCLCCAHELVATPFGKKISLGLAVFWGLRLIVQFFGYSAALWRGKTFETSMHVLFSLLWGYLTYIFTVIAVR